MLLARLAREHGRADVALTLGMFAMSEATTPGVGPVLAAHGLSAVPEAHCYLQVAGRRVDLTGLPPGRTSPFASLFGEETVDPDALAAYKVARHRAVVRQWAEARGLDPWAVWLVREACIAALGQGEA